MANFMSIEPVTGLNTINNLLRLCRLPMVPVSHPLIEPFTKMIVARELNMYFTRLRKEDVLLDLEDIDKLEDD